MTSKRSLLLALLLLAAPVFAQDQTLEPSSTYSENNTDCDITTAYTRTSDNSDATMCDGGDGTTAETYTLVLEFATPTSNPDTTTDAQTFICRAQRSNTDSSPTIRMDLACTDGTVWDTGSDQGVTADSPQDYTETFTYDSANCGTSGANAQLSVTVTRTGGSPSGRRSVDTVDCDWDVVWEAAGGRKLMVISEDVSTSGSSTANPGISVGGGPLLNTP